MTTSPIITYVRLEGVLSPLRAARAAAWIASRHQTAPRRALGLVASLASTSLLPALHSLDAGFATRLEHVGLRDASADRIAILAEEYATEVLAPSLRDAALDHLRTIKRSGSQLVLLSETLDDVLQHIRTPLRRFDEVHSNTLEMRNGRATGRLRAPLIGAQGMGRWVREHAATAGVDIADCGALASFSSDIPLLEAVGRPVAVCPDTLLRRYAAERDCSILELGP